jgi:hypothetical protein
VVPAILINPDFTSLPVAALYFIALQDTYATKQGFLSSVGKIFVLTVQ